MRFFRLMSELRREPVIAHESHADKTLAVSHFLRCLHPCSLLYHTSSLWQQLTALLMKLELQQCRVLPLYIKIQWAINSEHSFQSERTSKCDMIGTAIFNPLSFILSSLTPNQTWNKCLHLAYTSIIKHCNSTCTTTTRLLLDN